MGKKVLLATQKPFAKVAVDSISSIFAKKGYELVIFEKYEDSKDLITALNGMDAVIIRSDKMTKEVIGNAQKLKIIVRAGAGYDNIDLPAANSKKIVVMNTPGQNSNAVAELVFGLLITLARNKYNGKSGFELRGKNLGIHAYGNVGHYVNKIAKGFGMTVYAYDPFVKDEIVQKDGIIPVHSAEELYENSRIVSLHLPKIKETIESINYPLLKLMPEDGVLINTARAEVIHEDDLLKLLQERPKFLYGSDVLPAKIENFEQNCKDQIQFTLKKMGAQTEEANINAGIAAANQIIDFFENNSVKFQVNSF